MAPVIIEWRSFADTVFTGHEQHRIWIDNRDGDDMVVFPWSNAPDADGISSLIAQLLFVEAEAHAFFRNENNLVVPIGELGVDQVIAFFDLDGDDAAFAYVRVIGKVRFFDDTRSRRENDVQVFVPSLINDVRAGA